MQNDDYIIEEFEKDIWLYLDNDLPTERMNYWSYQIQQNPEIRTKFNEAESILTNYNNLSDENLDNAKFERMIQTATKRERLFLRIKSFFLNKNESESLFPKMAFVTTLTIAAIVILVISQKPNPVNKISSELLDWDDEITSTHIQNISNSISLIENDDMKKFILFKTTQGEWNKNIYRLENKIKNLDDKIDETSL
jgi:hypothetical protein